MIQNDNFPVKNDFSTEKWIHDIDYSFTWKQNGRVVGHGPTLRIEQPIPIKRLSRKDKKLISKKAEKQIKKSFKKLSAIFKS